MYSVVPKEPDTSYFYLHPDSGQLSLARVFGTEEQVEYRVKRHASSSRDHVKL